MKIVEYDKELHGEIRPAPEEFIQAMQGKRYSQEAKYPLRVPCMLSYAHFILVFTYLFTLENKSITKYRAFLGKLCYTDIRR